MKTVTRRICNFSFYDQQAIQKTLEDMAEQGWMLEKTGSFFWTYRRMEPKKLRFSVTYFPTASDFDPGPTDSELTRLEYCRQDGWVFVVSRGVMQIFYNENIDAVPIETEPVTQVENIRRAMRKQVLFPQAVLCVMLLWSLFIRISMWRQDIVGELSNPLLLYPTLMYVTLVLACLYEIVFYISWSRKAKAAAQNEGVFLPIQSRPVLSWILLAISAIALLLTYSAFRGPLGYALLWLCIVPLIMVIGNLIKRYLKKRGVSRNVNRMVSVISVVFLTFLLIGVLTVSIIRDGTYLSYGKNVVGTYELYGRTREIYDDPLPLEIEELADVRAQWSKEADHQETVLLSRTEYRQYAILMDGNDKVDEHLLNYTVTEVKWGFLYDFIKRAVLNARQDEIVGDYVFIDHYEPVDASVWDADEAYQRHWSESVLNTWLIFWENRIVEVEFFWEPTPEHISIAAEKLKNFSTD